MKEIDRPQAKPIEVISAIESTIAKEAELNVEKGIGPLASDPELEPFKYCNEEGHVGEQKLPNSIDPLKQRLIVGPCDACAARKLTTYRREKAETKETEELGKDQLELPLDQP